MSKTALPPPLESIREALAEASDELSALRKENIRLLAQISALGETIIRLKAKKKTNGGDR